ncbi:coatomer subunit beta' [Elysia marginata]|uniref:Coatomer subunit beta n=1 Tax=Elysia marginata TaxID=1093978 RepID=A0AAV4H2D2_9GAST|nr:coatomer subunit beta' [Elysia marginata]
MWHASTFKMVTILNFDMGRVWTLAVHQGSNNVSIGFDDGSMLIKLGREEPAISMDASGKIVWARHSQLQQANVKALQGQEVKDGEKLPLAVKEMGICEIYPQAIMHSPNGRFVSVCGDGEYTIYTGVALRNKAYGSAQEFVWSSDSSVYATRDGSSLITIFKNFKSHKSFKPDAGADG